MKFAPFLLTIQLFDVSSAVYKQWIPNTNFETAVNWDKNRIPCAHDAVHFESGKNISVLIQSTHSLKSMEIPWNGEFILASGAGFAVAADIHDAGCEKDLDITFKDTESYNWLDPYLWYAAASTDDLENGKYLFSVDEEQVPCQYDDVIFQPATSFRVNVEPSKGTISLKSISILGQRFNRHEEFARYLQTKTAQMQFHGPGSIQVTNIQCMDRTGCVCGNTEELLNICNALKQHSENQCPGIACRSPLKPIGHCCEICGATVSLEYSPDFDIEIYRSRLIHGFLSLAKYAGVRMAMSKVYKPQTFLGIPIRRAFTEIPEIQIVLMDDKNGSQTGTSAQLLASDMMADIANYGPSFGIVRGTVQIATGENSSGHGGHQASSWTTPVSVVAVLLFLLLTGIIVLLYRKHITRFRTWSFPKFWRTTYDPESTDRGFDNPIFYTETSATSDPQGLYSGEEALKGIPVKESAIFFVNPLYEENDSTI